MSRDTAANRDAGSWKNIGEREALQIDVYE
jgi:hypothetical protein